MKVVISSIHSDSINLIEKAAPQTVISFDAHPDLGHWNNLEIVRSIVKLEIPQEMKSALFRTSIQVLLRIALPQCLVISVVPEACVITDFNWNLFLKAIAGIPTRRKRFTKKVAILDWRRKLATLSIKGYMCPPRTLKPLLPFTENKSFTMDIDADYLFELTKTCFTPAGFSDTPIPVDSMPQDNLGSIKEILDFISLAKPKLVTISEIRSKPLNSNRDVLNFLKSLKNLGYNIEEGILYSNEEVADLKKIKADFESFYTKTAKSGSREEFFKAHLNFFRNKGLDI